MLKNTKKKRKEEEWVHAYLGVANGALATSNVCAQAFNSLGSLLLKLMFQALQAFPLLSIPSSKLSKLTLNRKPKCWNCGDGVSAREVEGGGVNKIEEVDMRKGGS